MCVCVSGRCAASETHLLARITSLVPARVTACPDVCCDAPGSVRNALAPHSRRTSLPLLCPLTNNKYLLVCASLLIHEMSSPLSFPPTPDQEISMPPTTVLYHLVAQHLNYPLPRSLLINIVTDFSNWVLNLAAALIKNRVLFCRW